MVSMRKLQSLQGDEPATPLASGTLAQLSLLRLHAVGRGVGLAG